LYFFTTATIVVARAKAARAIAIISALSNLQKYPTITDATKSNEPMIPNTLFIMLFSLYDKTI
jgi:hypothetical protein